MSDWRDYVYEFIDSEEFPIIFFFIGGIMFQLFILAVL